MSDRSSIFDMIGPVMIGPSSSHTAGVVRIGRVARLLLGAQPEKALITFYNSFARTYEGHGSDRAVLAGLLNMETDDERIRESLKHAQQNQLDYVFRSVSNASTLHPNTVHVEIEAGGRKTKVLGVSRGGGLISIIQIDGFRCSFSAQMHTLIVSAKDVPGSVAFISNVVAHEDCNIANLTVNRSAKNHKAKLVFEMDSGLRDLTIEYLKSLKWVEEINYIPDIGI